jgi:hypothetical protein
MILTKKGEQWNKLVRGKSPYLEDHFEVWTPLCEMILTKKGEQWNKLVRGSGVTLHQALHNRQFSCHRKSK